MIKKLEELWDTFPPNSFTVMLRKQHPDIYKWVLAQPDIIPTIKFTEKVFCLLNPVQPICANTDCNNLVTILGRNCWAECCSSKCKGQHNSTKSRTKAVITSNKNWGVDNPAQNTLIREKMKVTTKLNHGVEYAKQSATILLSTESTMIERYGVPYAAQSPTIQAETKKQWLEKFGVDNPAKRHIPQDTFDKLNDPIWLADQNQLLPLQPLSEKLGICSATLSLAFKKYNLTPVRHNIIVSDAELEIVNFIKSQSNTTVIESDREVISPYELDIYLPELNTAIEFNGNYWHSDLNGKDSKYHLNKTVSCAKKGIKLIHIWEYIYNQHKEIVRSKLNHILKNSNVIYGRKCTVKEIDLTTCKDFLNSTHLQGYCASSIRIGLYNGNDLVAAMTFGSARFSKGYEYELLRFSSKLNSSVTGAFSKILSHFIKTRNPESIVTYSDLTWSSGDVYKLNGFEYVHRAKPSYYYTADYINFEHRMAWQKKKMPSKLLNFDNKLSEWTNMRNHGYDRIWNCGNDVWVWHSK